MAILSGARNARDHALSKKLYRRMKFLFANQSYDLTGASILLANTYISVGKYRQAEDIRLNRLNQSGNKVKVGLSWTEVSGQLMVKYFFQSTYYIFNKMDRFFSNFELTIDLILNQVKYMLKSNVCQRN